MFTHKTFSNYKSLHKRDMRVVFKYIKQVDVEMDPFHSTGKLAKTFYNTVVSRRLRAANPKGTIARLTTINGSEQAIARFTWVNDKTQTYNLEKIINIPMVFRELIIMQRLYETENLFQSIKKIPTTIPIETDPPPVFPYVKSPKPWVTGFNPLENPEATYWAKQSPIVQGNIKGEKTRNEKRRDIADSKKTGKPLEYDILSEDLLALDWYNNPALLDRFQSRQEVTAKMKQKQEERLAKILAEQEAKKHRKKKPQSPSS